MAIPQIASSAGQKLRSRVFGSTRLTILLSLIAVLVVCLIFTWETGDVMSNLSFLNPRNSTNRSNGTKKALVDIKPWQTAQALAALAYTAEEKEYAQEAERLADHEVDQAFASALRQATLDAQHLKLSGDAQALSKKVGQLQQLISQDKDDIQTITAALKAPSPKDGRPAEYDEGDLEVAKAQLALDADELVDIQHDFDQASGDQTSQIQAELTSHEAAMRGYDKQVREGGQIATVSARRFGTLAGRLGAWSRLGSRTALLQQAIDQTRRDVGMLNAQQSAIETKISTMGAVSTDDLDEKLQGLRDRTALRQILSIADDRIQTEQQLVSVYSKWSAQVLLQRRIIVHLLLQSLALIAFIGICMVFADWLVQRFMSKPSLDSRRSQTLRSILKMSIQAVGVVVILLVIFGPPQETPTILGLATAALTIALQDFIIAFLGWFVLIGKNGIHVGDWVEINGVGGEVTDVRLFTTTLLETGTPAVVQNSYSLLDRADERGVLELCAAFGISYTPFGPLAGGWLTGKYKRDAPVPEGSRMAMRPGPYEHLRNEETFASLDRFAEIAAQRGVHPATLAISWLLAQPHVTAVVVGPRRPEQLEPALAALEHRLSQSEAEELAALFG